MPAAVVFITCAFGLLVALLLLVGIITEGWPDKPEPPLSGFDRRNRDAMEQCIVDQGGEVSADVRCFDFDGHGISDVDVNRCIERLGGVPSCNGYFTPDGRFVGVGN